MSNFSSVLRSINLGIDRDRLMLVMNLEIYTTLYYLLKTIEHLKIVPSISSE